MVSIRKFLEGIGLIPKASSTISIKGELEVLNSDGKIYYHDGTSVQPLLTATNTVTVTNKSMDGGSNTFTNLPAGSLTGTTSVSNGGTGVSTLTSNGVVIGNGTSPVTVTAEGATGTVLHGNTGADPSFSAVSLTADVSGILPVANGGTGDSTLTNHGVLIGQGTSPVAVTAAGTAGQPLLSGGASADPAYGTLAIGAGGTGQTTKAAAFDALSPMTTGGDLIYGGASGTGTRLANGTAGQILQSNGTTLAPTWVAQPVTSPLTTKGDIYGFSTVNARIPVGADRLALVADSSQTLGVKWGYPSGLRAINAQTGTTYTFVLADGSDTGGNPLVTATNASAQTYTVPPNSSVAFPVGTQIDLTQLGAGLVTVAQGAGVTINSLSGLLTMSGRYGAITLIKTATDVWELYGNGSASTVSGKRTINAQTGTTYTFVLTDGSDTGGNPLVTASNASAQTYTVPPNSSVAFPTGTQIDVLQLGAGKVTLAQGAGVTINSKGSNKAIGAQYVGVTLIKTGTDVWELLGDLIA